jgi:hypothetical protein
MESLWLFVAFVSGYSLSEFFRWERERWAEKRRAKMVFDEAKRKAIEKIHAKTSAQFHEFRGLRNYRPVDERAVKPEPPPAPPRKRADAHQA